MNIAYETYRLKNGITVILIPSNSTYSVTVSAMVKLGSATLENRHTQGITHFVEHTSFSATEKWPKKDLLMSTTEFNGASFNGSTAEESQSYYINVPYNKLEYGLEFIFQILYKCTFNAKYIEQERTIIQDEIDRRRDDIVNRAFNYQIKMLSKKKSSYILEVTGTKDIIAKISVKDLIKHYKTAHDPSKVFLTLVGNFNQPAAKRLINKLYLQVQNQNISAKYPAEEIAESVIRAKFDAKTNMIFSSITFKGKGISEINMRDDVVNNMIEKILTGTSSSRLMKRLREKEGLLYTISSNDYEYENFGYKGIYFKVIPEKYEKTLQIVLEELRKFTDKGITRKELEHFQEYIINRNLVVYDNIHDYSRLIKYPIFYNKDVVLLDKLNDMYKSLTIREINSRIRDLYRLEKASIAAYGKVKNTLEDKIKEILDKSRQS